jgi:hypothetical protein
VAQLAARVREVEHVVIVHWKEPKIDPVAGIACGVVLQVSRILVVWLVTVAIDALGGLVLVVVLDLPRGLFMAQVALGGESHLVGVLDVPFVARGALGLGDGGPVAFGASYQHVAVCQVDFPIGVGRDLCQVGDVITSHVFVVAIGAILATTSLLVPDHLLDIGMAFEAQFLLDAIVRVVAPEAVNVLVGRGELSRLQQLRIVDRKGECDQCRAQHYSAGDYEPDDPLALDQSTTPAK